MSETTTPTGIDATNFADATDAQVQAGLALLFGVQAGTQNATKPQGLTVTPMQVAVLAAPLAVDPVLAAIQQIDQVNISGSTALTLAEHGGKSLLLLPGATISLAWADTGPTFGCAVTNETGAPVQPQLASDFTYPVPRNASGFTQIANQGLAGITCQAWTDSAGTDHKVCRLDGATVG